MKNLLLIPIAFSMLAGQKPGNNITGQIKGLVNDTLVITHVSMANLSDISGDSDARVRYDTITAPNGRLSYNIAVDGPTEVIISPVQLMDSQRGKRYSTRTSDMRFFFGKGEQVRIDGQIDSTVFNCKVSGTRLNEDYSNYYAKQLPLLAEITRLRNAMKGKTREEQKALSEKMQEVSKQRQGIAMDYIKSNPNNPLAGYCMLQVPIDSVQTYYERLGDAARNSIFKPMIERLLSQAEKYRQTQITKANITAGKPAPDFTLKKIDGTEFTLSSLRGKYVVLDFWGSWCGWCIKGIPEMKKYYEKYAGKFEIVGIACGDTEPKWQKSVADNTLPWINVINQPTVQDMSTKYAIEGYPTKIILGPDGLIVAVIVGESPEFYKKLDELLQ